MDEIKETKLCKHCQSEIPKKAKVCPVCRRKQSGKLKWIFIGIVFIFVLFTMFGGSENDNSEGQEYSEKDFEIKEYIYENSIRDTIYLLAITNNSGVDVSVSGNATAKDSDGNSIGADDMEIAILGAGETSIGYFYFDNVTGIDSVDYKLNYNDDLYYSPVIKNLKVEKTENAENVVVTLTNNGDKAAEFVEAYALFFDKDGKLLNYDSDYITDDDFEIKVGDTLSLQLNCYEKYDHAEVYLTGRASE